MTGRSRWIGVAAVTAVVGGIGVAVLAGNGGDRDRAGESCTRTVDPDWTVARHWNEAALAAIRSDFPSPTVHARNLYHSSAAMWDAWSAYEIDAQPVFVDETVTIDANRLDGADGIDATDSNDDTDSIDATDSEVLLAAREEAMSYAAYRVLFERYLASPGAEEAVTALDDLMAGLCFDIDDTETVGDTPAALGNRIAADILSATVDDGSRESDDYIDPDYAPVNEPLVVDRAGTAMIDPNRWQPLELEEMVAQNGLPLSENVQSFVGPHWGDVVGFALPPPDDRGIVTDPGPPPLLGDAATDRAFKEAVNEVLRYSALLDPASTATIDLSPATQGNTPLGTYEPAGHTTNPATGEPYEPAEVSHADYGRVVAEYWADGPQSETPPGHWNSIANRATDALAETGRLRIGGAGPEVDRLEWDVKLYLALNGALHDAAIAAWGVKGHYDYARPISMIRHMAGLGQSSDPAGPSYHRNGLLLEDGLVEVITEASSAPGERHDHLAGHVGEVAVRAWQGEPVDLEADVGGVGWILGVAWVPYQRSTFVTPSFAGYVSGHSTFSRAAAEVLTAITGDEFFPGGLAVWPVEAGGLEFEVGPDDTVVLQWATYRDAADEAGLSRLYGGIHVRADDLAGRRIGAEVGVAAWDHARAFFGGGG